MLRSSYECLRTSGEVRHLVAGGIGVAGDSADGFGRGERPEVGQVDSELQGGLLAGRDALLGMGAI